MKIIISSTNKLKVDACKFAFEKFFLEEQIEVEGFKVESNVADQPIGFEETYKGAKNRLENLKVITKEKKINFDYLVSVEGGNTNLLPEMNGKIGFEICIIENNKGNESLAMDFGIIIPMKYFKDIPDKYADLGILFQQVYGMKEKDPYTFFSSGKIGRIDVC